MRKSQAIALLALTAILAYPVKVATQATVSILASGSQAITKGALLIPDSYLKLGKGTPNTTPGEGDAFFSGDLEVAGDVSFSGDIFAANLTPDANVPMTIGTGAVESITFETDGGGNAEIVMPENAIGPTEFGAPVYNVILCGELAENGTTYFGPSTGAFGGNGADLSIGSTACDALDNATEATADAPLFVNTAFRVLGGYCKTDGTLGASETLTFTVRSATGSLSGATCAIGVGASDCNFGPQTSNVLSGATLAVKADEVSNNADDNGWCMLAITTL